MANESSIDELLGNVRTRQAATHKEPSALPRWASMVVQERWNQHYSPSPWAVDTNEYVRHFKGTTFIAIGAIARKVAQQEAKVFHRIRRKSGVIKEPVDPTHPLYTLFDQVNPVHTQYDLWYQMISWRLLTGNSYWWKARNAFGEIKELWPLPSQWVWAIPSSTQFISEYLVRGVFGGGNTYIPSKDVLHVREHSIDWSGPGRYYGTPLATAGATAIDLEEAMLTRLYWQFKNFHPPGLHYSTDKELTDDQFHDMLVQLRMQQQTAEQSGMPILSHSGTKIDDSTTTVREMDYNRSLQMIMDYLLALFGTPRSVVGLSREITRANLVGGLLAWAENTINPLLVHTGQHLTQGVGKEFGEDIVVAFDPIEVADADGLRSDVSAAQSAGAITPNEVREVLLKRPPFKKGGNRVFFQGTELDFGNVEESNGDGNQAIAPASAGGPTAPESDPAINGDVIAGNHVTPSEAAQVPQSPSDGTLHAPPPGAKESVSPNDIEAMIASDDSDNSSGDKEKASSNEWAGEDIDDDVIESLDKDDDHVENFRKLLKSESRDTAGLSIQQIERMTQWLALHGREENRVADAVANFLGDQKRRILDAVKSRTDLHPTDAMSLIDWQKEDAALHALMVNLLTDTRKAGINAMARRMAGRSRTQVAAKKRSLRKSLDFLLKLPELADALARQALGTSLSAPYWSLVNATTLKGLFQAIVAGIADQLSLPEIAKKIMGDSGGFFGRVRAKAIARTEVSSSLNAAQMSVIEEVNASPDMYPVAMEWLAIDDKDVRPAHWSANGQIIVPGVAGMDQFTLKDAKGTEQCHFPAEGTLSARNRINCRCAVVEVFPEELPEGHPVRVKLEEIYSKGNLAVMEKRATATVDDIKTFDVRLPAAIDPAFADVRELASDDAIASRRLLKIAPRRRTLTTEDMSNVGSRSAAYLDTPVQSSDHYAKLFASIAGQSTLDGGKYDVQPSGSLVVQGADGVVTYVASQDGKVLGRRYVPEQWADGTRSAPPDSADPDSPVTKAAYEVELTTWGLSAHLVRKFAAEDAAALGMELSESRGHVLVKSAEIRRQVTRLPDDAATLAKRFADLAGKPARAGEFAVSPCGHLVAKCGDFTVYVASADGRVLDSEFVPAEMLKALDSSPVDLSAVKLDPAKIPEYRPERLVVPDKVAAEGAALWRRRCRMHDVILSHMAKLADVSARNGENMERDINAIREKIDAVRPALANLDAKVDAWTSRTGIKASEAYYAVAGQTWDGSTIRSLTTPITESRQRQRDQRERLLDDDSTRPVAVTCPVAPSKSDEDIVKMAAASWLRCALSTGMCETWQEEHWTSGDILRAFKLLRGDIPAGDSPGYSAMMRTLTQLPANAVLTAEGWRSAGLPSASTLDDESLLSMISDAATREQILSHTPERVSAIGPNCWHAQDGISPKATYAMAIQKCPIDVLDDLLKYIAQDLLASQNAGFSDGETLTPDVQLWEGSQLRLLADELSKQSRRLPPATKWDRDAHKFVLDVDGVFDAARVAFWRYTDDYETFKVGFAKDWCEGGEVSRAVVTGAMESIANNGSKSFWLDVVNASLKAGAFDMERCYEHARMLLSESQLFHNGANDNPPTISVATTVPGEVVAYAPSPVESWTCDRHTLKRLASGLDKSTILRTTIPTSGVLFSWDSMAENPGWWSELRRNFKREVVVLGGAVERVTAG